MKLRSKILLPICTIIILCSVFLILLSSKKQEDTIQTIIQDQVATQIDAINTITLQVAGTVVQLAEQYQFSAEEVAAIRGNLNSQKVIDNTDIGKTGYLFAINKEGLIWAHKDHDKIGTNILDEKWADKDILEKDNGTYEFTENDIDYHVYFKDVGDNINVQVAVYTLSDFEEEINSIRNLQLIVLAITMILIVLTVFYIIQSRILTPINYLVQKMQRVAKGELNSTIKINSNDEIGYLGTEFNTMVTDMRGIVIKLRDTVRIINNSSQSISNSSNLASESSKQINFAIHEIAVGVNHLANDAGKTYHSTNELAIQINNVSDKLSLDTDISFSELIVRIQSINEDLEQIVHGKNATLSSIHNISVVTETSAAAVEEIYATIEAQGDSIERISASMTELNFIVNSLSREIEKFKY